MNINIDITKLTHEIRIFVNFVLTNAVLLDDLHSMIVL
jgi:hypothetical protein